jgi:hypothetical protein
MKITDKHVFFWRSAFSNWHISPFVAEIEGKKLEFTTSEQYFMYVKAITFKDYETAERILKEGISPRIAKDLGRLVKNYDDKVWDEKRYQVMLDANILKFTQHKESRDILLNPKFDGKHFVESSPVDRIWGVGLGENDPLIVDEKNWRGRNLLGKVLDEVRERLLKEK